MPVCDVCGSSTSRSDGATYSAERFRVLVKNGFEPDSLTLFRMAETMHVPNATALERWKFILVPQSHTDWLLCPDCAGTAKEFENKPQPPLSPALEIRVEDAAIPARPERTAIPTKAWVTAVAVLVLLLAALFGASWWNRRLLWPAVGLQGMTVRSLGVLQDGTIFANVSTPSESNNYGKLGLYYSSDGGRTWNRKWIQRPQYSECTKVLQITERGDIFCRRGNVIQRSNDQGASWQEIYNKPSDSSHEARALVTDRAGNIYLTLAEMSSGTRATILKSGKKEGTWETVYQQRLADPENSGSSYFINDLVASNETDVYAWTERHLLYSRDSGLHWEQLQLPTKTRFYEVIIQSPAIYLATFGDVYFSPNQGTDWTTFNLGRNVTSLYVSETQVFAGFGDGSISTRMKHNSEVIRLGQIGCGVTSLLPTKGGQLLAGGMHNGEETSGGVHLIELQQH